MTGPGLGPVTRCRSCAAEIRWAWTPAGKKMPLDAGDSRENAPNVALVEGFAVVLGPLDAEHTPTHVPHWATCPDAPAWKGTKP